MRRSPFALRAAAIAIGLALSSSATLARADGPALTPPRLSRFVQADDPRPGDQVDRVTIDLELDVDREGTVTAVRLLSPSDEALDAAAVRAARTFSFDPATRDGVNVAARIRYAYVFAAREPAPAPTAPPPPDDRSTTAAAATATEGTDGTPPSDPVDPDAFTATARVEAPPREVTKRTLSHEEMTHVAGTRGDPLRAVELMPGVSRSPSFGDGSPILRGANPADSQVFLEGAPVPLLYHFGGLTSFVHGRVLDTVEVYPGNFGVRYGRKVGGVIDVRLRDPKTDRLHGLLDLNLIDSSAVVETPIGDRFAFLGAARRSNVDVVLNSANDLGGATIQSAPVYWDYQSVAAYRPTDADRIRLVAYGSSDRVAVLQAKPDEDDPTIRGAFDVSTVFHRVQLGYRHRWAGGSEQNTELTFGRTSTKLAFGRAIQVDFTISDLQGRSEWVSVLSPAIRVVGGVDVLAGYFDGGFSGVPPSSGEGDGPAHIGNQRRTTFQTASWLLQPGAYLEAGLRPVPSVLIVPGVRADYNDLVRKGSVDPRLSARWDAAPKTAFKAGIGRFSQAPQEAELVEPIGNPNLDLIRATHVSSGVEQRVGDDLSMSVEGFAKWIDGVVVGTPGGRPPAFVNGQEGRIFGAEAMVRLRPAGRFFGFVSYTLSRSERRDAGGDWRLFDRDMTHLLGAAGVYRLGRGWEVGASFRLTSGAPYTPVVSATYDATADIYAPRLGRAMSARNPAFSRVDVRVEKKWTFAAWSLAAYLDVQNLLNAENREGFNYSYDYRRREGQGGLPILPSLGLRGEL